MDVRHASPADGVVVMSVEGDVDIFAASEFKEHLFHCIDQDARNVVIDMSGSQFIDSTGLGVLVSAVKYARGKTMAIVCNGDTLGRIFSIVGLDKVFALHETLPEALAATAAAGF